MTLNTLQKAIIAGSPSGYGHVQQSRAPLPRLGYRSIQLALVAVRYRAAATVQIHFEVGEMLRQGPHLVTVRDVSLDTTRFVP